MTSSTSVSPRATSRPPAPGATVPPRAVRVDWYHRRPEVYVASATVAQIVSGLIALLVVAGMVRWSIEAYNRYNVPGDVRPFQFRFVQLELAIAGLVAAATLTVYLVYYAATGVIWRFLREVSISFACLASAWTAVWFLDRFVLDAFFLR